MILLFLGQSCCEDYSKGYHQEREESDRRHSESTQVEWKGQTTQEMNNSALEAIEEKSPRMVEPSVFSGEVA